MTPADDAFEGLKDAFLSRYEARSLQETAPFPFVPPLLDRLEAAGLPWGIMTNKHARFAVPIVSALGLQARATTVVCGDTASRPSPSPIRCCCAPRGWAWTPPSASMWATTCATCRRAAPGHAHRGGALGLSGRRRGH